MSAEALKDYLDAMGILSCNMNPYLPCLEDIGCTWTDAVALIDAHQLFFCKCYRKRTIYLSPEVYYLLKSCRAQRAMTKEAGLVYALLEQTPGMESRDLRAALPLSQPAFVKALDFLLEERYVTAIANGTWLNPSWSTYHYGTARTWESLTPAPVEPPQDPEGQLQRILARSLPEEELDRLLQQPPQLAGRA